MRTRMRLVVAFLLLALAGGSAWARPEKKAARPEPAKKPLRLEEIFAETGLTGRMPTQMRWSPDGRQLSYILQADDSDPSTSLGTGQRDLWVVEAESGEKKILVSYNQLRRLAPAPEQAAPDERGRERLLRYAVAAYVWSPDSKAILFSSAGQLYLFDLAAGTATALAPKKSGVGDPKFSPDGRWISFLYQHDLWVVPATGGQEKQVTRGGTESVLHGELDWVYPEELGIRTGYEWSPDSCRIAFLELDEHSVPTYPITDLVPVGAKVDFQRYPKAGDPNPKVRLGIVEVEAGAKSGGDAPVVWLDRAAEYIPRFAWVDAGRLGVQLLNRAQTELELVVVAAATGRSQPLLAERDSYWVNVSDDLKFLPASGEFLWTSERTGFRHIYLYGFDGREKQALTSGDWEVNALEGVDTAGGWVYYTSNQRNPLGRDFYRVKLDGTAAELLTPERGTHSIVMNPAATAYAVTYSSLSTPPTVSVRHLASGRATAAYRSRSVEEYEMVVPEEVEMRAADGALVRGRLLRPQRLEPGRRYPVLVYVYGGPHAPVIRDAWGGNRYLFHQYLVQQGFVVFYMDDRASSLLGHKYEVALHRRYGPTALADHRVGVEYLRRLPFVDGARIGVWGWSGGGFSTCFDLTHGDLFKVGVAVAPVTDWHLYDSIYTERYLGLPQQEPEAYRVTSAVEAAGKLEGRLLLVHGDADDNVHIQNTGQLLHALEEVGKTFDLMVYPRKTHSLRGAKTQLHLFRTITAYLKDRL